MSIADYISEGSGTLQRGELRRIASVYPWFLTAQKLLDDKFGELHTAIYLQRLYGSVKEEPSELGNEVKTEVVDAFLHSGDYKIQPADEDGCADSLIRQDNADDDMVTEQLAEIYEKQGLYGEAKAIYAKLSLLDPKKSVYFAEIISRLDEKIINN